MTANNEYDALDKLLARPAHIADKGFSERISYQVKKRDSLRWMVFLVVGGLWLVSVAVAFSPQEVYEGLSRFIAGYDFMVQTFRAGVEMMPRETPDLQSLLSLLALASIAVLALLSFAMREMLEI